MLIACSSSPFNCHHLCIDFLYLSHFFKFQFSFSFSTKEIKKIKNYIKQHEKVKEKLIDSVLRFWSQVKNYNLLTLAF